ncbi:MAG TPA: hypothetical protein VEU98_06645 [Candidatus Eremiobacteraceae bacterium]|nr:hypothetical protein [Candidatus Eremiobacteraceae bacterium]
MPLATRLLALANVCKESLVIKSFAELAPSWAFSFDFRADFQLFWQRHPMLSEID